MLIPYKCKNPPEQVPYATYSLIGLNVLVYLFTTHRLLEIKDGIVADYALAPSNIGPIRLITSLFLHGDPFHIGGNMLFLWLFGASVEGRLRIPKYLLVYFISGIAGGLAQCWSETAIHVDIPSFGASGAIMGLAGAYIYIFPNVRIMVFRFFSWGFSYIRFGPAEWLAWWVVAYFMGYTILDGLIGQAMGVVGGVAYFAHIGGFSAGFLSVLALRTRRDSEVVSSVQAVRSDLGNDFTLMNVDELEYLVDAPTENMPLVLAYCSKSLMQGGSVRIRKAKAMLDRYKQPLLMNADAGILAETVLNIPVTDGGLPGPFYLRLGGKLEQIHRIETAAYVYRRAYDLYSMTPDGGAALMRLARIWERVFNNLELAKEAYEIYLSHFAQGPLVDDAEKGLERVKSQLKLTPQGAPPMVEQNAVPESQPMLTQQPVEDTPASRQSTSRPFAVPDFND